MNNFYSFKNSVLARNKPLFGLKIGILTDTWLLISIAKGTWIRQGLLIINNKNTYEQNNTIIITQVQRPLSAYS